MQTITVGGIMADQIRLFKGLPTPVRVHPGRQIIAPGKALPFDTAARGLLPFGLRGQTIGLSRHVAQPATVGYGIEPTDCNHRLIWMLKTWEIPALGDAVTCRPQETSVLPIGHWKLADGEGAQPDPVYRLLILLNAAAAHEKRTLWDAHQFRFDNERRGLRAEG